MYITRPLNQFQSFSQAKKTPPPRAGEGGNVITAGRTHSDHRGGRSALSAASALSRLRPTWHCYFCYLRVRRSAYPSIRRTQCCCNEIVEKARPRLSRRKERDWPCKETPRANTARSSGASSRTTHQDGEAATQAARVGAADRASEQALNPAQETALNERG